MPYTEEQQIAARIAEHHPSQLFKRNRGFLAMDKEELHKMATGKLKKKKRKSLA